MQRVDQLIGQFLKLNYELSLWTVYGTLRGMLLEDMEAVHCKLCGSNGHVEVARKDKFNLAVRSVMCRQCGLIYLNQRPTARSYARFNSEGGSEEGVYHIALGPRACWRAIMGRSSA